jgi:putative hemolysin
MKVMTPQFKLALAASDADLAAAQRLRYDVFVTELGGDSELTDHDAQREQDHFDAFSDHLLLRDLNLPQDSQVVGVYRLLRGDQALTAGGFYSATEYDLALLQGSGRRLLELGRSCLHRAYRGGPALFHLWQGLAAYIADHRIEILFGVASFHGTDLSALAQPLSLLHASHLAPPGLRVRARPSAFQPMDLIPADQIDRKLAVQQTPALIKAYVRMGGCVGEGAYIDHAFNTTDVCMILDTDQLSDRQRALYQRAPLG